MPLRGWGALATGLGLSLALLSGCDTTQPTMDTAGKDVTIDFAMVNATVDLYDVWDVVGDFDGDGNVDPQTRFCQRLAQNLRTTREVPWNFTAEIEVIPVGATTGTVVTQTSAAFNEAFNQTADDTVVRLGQTPARPNFPGIPAAWVFSNPRRLSGGHRDVLGDGLLDCKNSPPLPNASVGSSSLPLTLSLNRGDTVIVRARRGTGPLPGLEVFSSPQLSSSLILDGQVATVSGTSVTTAQVGSPLSYSFTVR